MTAGIHDIVKEGIENMVAETIPATMPSEGMEESFAREELMKEEDEPTLDITLNEKGKIEITSSPNFPSEIENKLKKTISEQVDKYKEDKEGYLSNKFEQFKSLMKEQKKTIDEKSKQLSLDTSALHNELRKFNNMNKSYNKAINEYNEYSLDSAKKTIDNAKISPLEEILERTGFCTVIEQEPGFLKRMYPDTVDEETEKIMNTPVVTRMRYLIKEVSPLFVGKTKKEVIYELETLLMTAYAETWPDAPDHKDQYLIEDLSSIKGESKFSIRMIPNPGATSFVSMDVVIDSEKIWMGRDELI